MSRQHRCRRVARSLLLTAVVLSGCGQEPAKKPSPRINDQPAASHTKTAAPSASQSRRRAQVRPPPNPPRSVPTRLVGGPIVLRVVGDTLEPFVRYTLIFRLNRPQQNWPKDPNNRDGPPPLPPGADDPLGNYEIAGFAFDFDYSIFSFDPASADQPDRDNCFYGTISTDLPDQSIIRKLDKIPDGGRVRVRLHPLTPKPDGKPKYGPVYVRHPQIIRAHVDGSSYLQVLSIPALTALEHAGCSVTVLSS